ncbi:MAG: hypothetical protein MI919_28545 [Holophagales bacterium]|nr:hypothetical protein [Holophagales bacterium]
MSPDPRPEPLEEPGPQASASTTPAPSEEPAPERSPIADRLRDKAPEILLEVVSVVLAVFLALAVNGWADEAQERRQAERARQGVLDEIDANYQELLSKYPQNRENLEQLRAAVEELRAFHEISDAGGEAVMPEGVSANFSLSLLSSASWRAAQLTLAVHHLEYSWISRVAKLYELQEIYDSRQDDLVAFLTSMGQMEEGDELRTTADLANRFDTALSLVDGLLRAYAGLHPELEVPSELLDPGQDPEPSSAEPG